MADVDGANSAGERFAAMMLSGIHFNDRDGSFPVALRNAHLAGKVHPKTGIPFDKSDYPDFSSVAKNQVQIKQTTKMGQLEFSNEGREARSSIEVHGSSLTGEMHTG